MSTEQSMRTPKEARQRRETIYWASVLIWAGVVVAADQLGVLPQMGRTNAWSWIFLGTGVLALVGSLLRSAAPDRPDGIASLWNYVWAAIMPILGLSPLAPVRIGFPLILLLIGGALLATA